MAASVWLREIISRQTPASAAIGASANAHAPPPLFWPVVSSEPGVKDAASTFRAEVFLKIYLINKKETASDKTKTRIKAALDRFQAR